MKKTTGNGLDNDALVAGAYDTRKFQLSRKTKFLLAAGKRGTIHTDTERKVVLPNGHTVRVHVDASGKATHIEEDERLHAVVRPDTFKLKLTKEQ